MTTPLGAYSVNRGNVLSEQWEPWEVQADTGPPPPPPPPGGMLADFIGMMSSPANVCPVTVDDWSNSAKVQFPGLNAIKMFYYPTDTLPTSFSHGHKSNDNESTVPAGNLTLVTYWTENTNVQSYVESIPPDREVVLIWAQEAEGQRGSVTTGADFITRFTAQSVLIKAAAATAGLTNVKVAQDSAGSAYANSANDPAKGLWAVDPEHVDYYMVDSYQNFNPLPAGGIAGLNAWNHWLGVFAGRGRQLGIAEYGIPSCNGNLARQNRLCLDAHYLRRAFTPGGPGAVSPFTLKLWNYWWSNCSQGGVQASCTRQHKFLDVGCISTFNTILAGQDASLPAGS